MKHSGGNAFQEQMIAAEGALGELESRSHGDISPFLIRRASSDLSQEFVAIFYVVRNTDYLSDSERPTFKQFVTQLESNMHLCDIRASYQARRRFARELETLGGDQTSSDCGMKSEVLFCESRPLDRTDSLPDLDPNTSKAAPVLYASPPTENSQRVTFVDSFR